MKRVLQEDDWQYRAAQGSQFVDEDALNELWACLTSPSVEQPDFDTAIFIWARDAMDIWELNDLEVPPHRARNMLAKMLKEFQRTNAMWKTIVEPAADSGRDADIESRLFRALGRKERKGPSTDSADWSSIVKAEASQFSEGEHFAHGAKPFLNAFPLLRKVTNRSGLIISTSAHEGRWKLPYLGSAG